MRNIEPRVYRQRLIVECKLDKNFKITEEIVRRYLTTLTNELRMSLIHGPIVGSWAKDYKPDKYDGVEGFVAWIESGAHFHSWERYNFITLDIT